MPSTYPIPPAMAALFVRRVVTPARPAEAPVRADEVPAAAAPAAAPVAAEAAAPPPRRHLRRGSLLDIFV